MADALILMRQGLIILICAVSPDAEDRESARAKLLHRGFLEVYVDCPLNICMERDSRGIYRKLASKEITQVAGVDYPYVPPVRPDVHCLTGQHDVKHMPPKFTMPFQIRSARRRQATASSSSIRHVRSDSRYRS
ncbi:adenylyl-sulfate kinase [Terriglobus albidus]|uniref:adenylyl-sulfate kinase n=1 Tax=Terriglobus albidus TaxID=1592106 RepID=UPI0037DA7233